MRDTLYTQGDDGRGLLGFSISAVTFAFGSRYLKKNGPCQSGDSGVSVQASE